MRLHPGYEQRPDDPNFIDMEKTPMHEIEIAFYLREAWKEMMGSYPSKQSLAIVWSQVVLETGRNTDRTSNSMMRNWNYGNIKRNLKYSPYYTSYDAGEFLADGKHHMFYPYHPQTFFAAWKGPLEGAAGYLQFLSKRARYAKAWIELQKGDAVSFVRELKFGGYFTAPLDKYTEFVVSRVEEFYPKYDRVLNFVPEGWKEEFIEIDVEVPVYEPPQDINFSLDTKNITDLVPMADNKDSKLGTIANVFFKFWEFLQKALRFLKR